MEVLEIIRVIAPEFESLLDEELDDWIEIVKPMVSSKQFGKLYNQAVALLVCHRLKLAGYGESAYGSVSGTSSSGSSRSSSGMGLSVSSISDGGTSISFNSVSASDLTSSSGADAQYALTIYGVQFLQIRKSVIVPIHVTWGGPLV